MVKNFSDYVGRLTQEETAELLAECLYQLPDELIFGVLGHLTDDQKAELVELWAPKE